MHTLQIQVDVKGYTCEKWERKSVCIEARGQLLQVFSFHLGFWGSNSVCQASTTNAFTHWAIMLGKMNYFKSKHLDLDSQKLKYWILTVKCFLPAMYL